MATQFARHNERVLAGMQARLIDDISGSIKRRQALLRRGASLMARAVVGMPAVANLVQREWPDVRAKLAAFITQLLHSRKL